MRTGNPKSRPHPGDSSKDFAESSDFSEPGSFWTSIGRTWDPDLTSDEHYTAATLRGDYLTLQGEHQITFNDTGFDGAHPCCTMAGPTPYHTADKYMYTEANDPYTTRTSISALKMRALAIPVQ